jgi:hypothetical protein
MTLNLPGSLRESTILVFFSTIVSDDAMIIFSIKGAEAPGVTLL